MNNCVNYQQPLTSAALAVVLFMASLNASAVPSLYFATPTFNAQQSASNESASQSTSQRTETNQSENEDENTDARQNDMPSPEFNALSARAWMKRLANITQQASFEIAYVVTSPNKEISPYIWRHAILDNGDNAEQLSLLNGPGYEQIRINNRVSIFEPGFNPYSINAPAIDGPVPMALIHQLETAYASYEVLLMGRNRIAGRMAQQIRVVSKDKTRYGYHLWLDEQTGLLLKMNMYNLNGALIEQIQVTQLSVSDDIKNYFANIQKEQLPPLVVASSQNRQQLDWTVSYMPVGMQVVKQNLHRLSLTGQPAEYMMLSDGLVDVSVYVMSANEAIQEDISVSSDTTSVVSISDGRVQVTVVGEIPTSTANEIANSIVLIRPKP